MKSVAFHFSTKKLPCIWATFDRNHVTKNFKKSPNLVTLNRCYLATDHLIQNCNREPMWLEYWLNQLLHRKVFRYQDDVIRMTVFQVSEQFEITFTLPT